MLPVTWQHLHRYAIKAGYVPFLSLGMNPCLAACNFLAPVSPVSLNRTTCTCAALLRLSPGHVSTSHPTCAEHHLCPYGTAAAPRLHFSHSCPPSPIHLSLLPPLRPLTPRLSPRPSCRLPVPRPPLPLLLRPSATLHRHAALLAPTPGRAQAGSPASAPSTSYSVRTMPGE